MTKNLTEGSPAKRIFFFTMPLIAGNIFQQLYAFVDTLIVGRFLGVNALAAVGCTGALMFLMLGFVIGFSTGLSIYTGQRGGRGPAGGGAGGAGAPDDKVYFERCGSANGRRKGGCDGRCRHRAKKLVHSYLLFMVVTRPVRGSLLRSVCRRQGRLSVVKPTHEDFHCRALTQSFRQSPVTTPSMLKSSLSVISVTG